MTVVPHVARPSLGDPFVCVLCGLGLADKLHRPPSPWEDGA